MGILKMSKVKANKNIDALLSSSEEEVPKKKVTKKTKKVVESSSDESSSESVEFLKKKTERKGSNTKKANAATAKKPVKKVESSSSSSDDSSSEEVVKKAPVKKAAPKKKVESSSDESSSEEVVKKAPVKKAAPKKVESSSSEESSSEEVVKKAPVKKVVKKVESSDSDDDSSSEEVVKKAPAKKAAPKKVVESSSDESSSEEVVTKKPAKKVVKAESSDEEEESIEFKPQPKPVQQAAPESNCTELFVKNLPWSADENKLYEYFGTYGTVNNVKVLYDKMTGKARGLAFVDFSSRAEAQAALDDIANLIIDGRNLQCTFSDQKPQAPSGNGFNKPQGGYGGNQGGFQKKFHDGEKFTAFVGNLGFKTSEASVAAFFKDCGNVLDVRIAKNPEDGRSKGYAHVDFDSNEAVQSAMGKAGQNLDGRDVRVDASTPRQGGGDRGGRGGFGGRGGRGGFGGRGGRGGFGGNPMDKAKKSGGIIASSQATKVTFDDDDE